MAERFTLSRVDLVKLLGEAVIMASTAVQPEGHWRLRADGRWEFISDDEEERMPAPPDEMIYGSTEPDDVLTKGESNLLARLREMDNWDEWLLFVNAGFEMEDARGLADRGLIECAKIESMPAARLWRAPANTPPT